MRPCSVSALARHHPAAPRTTDVHDCSSAYGPSLSAVIALGSLSFDGELRRLSDDPSLRSSEIRSCARRACEASPGRRSSAPVAHLRRAGSGRREYWKVKADRSEPHRRATTSYVTRLRLARKPTMMSVVTPAPDVSRAIATLSMYRPAYYARRMRRKRRPTRTGPGVELLTHPRNSRRMARAVSSLKSLGCGDVYLDPADPRTSSSA